MSTLSDMCDASISAAASFAGQTVEYRAGTTGAWTALTKAYFKSYQAESEADDTRGQEKVVKRGRLTTSLSDTLLQDGYQIRINATDSNIWMIVGGGRSEGQRIYDDCRWIDVLRTNGGRRGRV